MISFDRFATSVVNEFGKKRFDQTGNLNFLIFIFTIFTILMLRWIGDGGSGADELHGIYNMVCALFLISLAVLLFFMMVDDAYEYSHCTLCGGDLATDIISNQTYGDTTITSYRCRYCGHMRNKIFSCESLRESPP
jgi:hypothetical protein